MANRLTEDERRERHHAQTEREIVRLADKIERHAEALRKIGENDMGVVSSEAGSRIRRITRDLSDLATAIRGNRYDPNAVTHMVALLRSDLTDEQTAADYYALNYGDPLRQLDLARAVVNECRRLEETGMAVSDRGKAMFLLIRAQRTACMSFGWTANGKVIGKTGDDRTFGDWTDCWTAIAGKA